MADLQALGIDLECGRREHRFAVQLKHQQRRVSYPQVERFLDLLLQPQVTQFGRRGILIANQGFSATAIALAQERTDVFLQLGIYQFGQQDPKFRFIDPDECSIRNSRQLFYWGHHLFTGGPGELAFTSVGGRCVPKEDFLNLLDYLQRITDLDRHCCSGIR